MDVIHALIVDDDPDIRQLYSAALSNAGFSVDTANDGADALAKMETYHPELIIADVQMPLIDGYELCRRIRSDRTKDIPFIFCSTLGSLPQRIEGLALGADDYLVKPVDLEELVLKVGLHIARNDRFRVARQGLSGDDESLRGNLADLEFYQVIQLISQLGHRSVHITVQSAGGEGSVWVHEGQLVHADLGEAIGKKAFLRLLEIEQGTFQVSHSLWVGEPTLSGSPDSILLGAMAELDEYRLLRSKVDEAGGWLTIVYSKNLFGRWLDEIAFTVLGLVDEQHEIQAILDACPLPDISTMRFLAQAQHLGTVQVSPPPEGSEI